MNYNVSPFVSDSISLLSSRFPGSFSCSQIPFLSVPSMFSHHDCKMAIAAPSLTSSLVSFQSREEGKEGELFLTCHRLISEDCLLQKTRQHFHQSFPPPYERLGNRISGHSGSLTWRNSKTSKKEREIKVTWLCSSILLLYPTC